MAFIGAVVEAAQAALEEVGARYVRSVIPNIVRLGINSGYSGAEIQRQLRSVGAGMRSQNLYGLIQDIRSSMAAGESIAKVDLWNIPQESDFARWDVTHGNGYIYQMNFHYVTHNELGAVEERGTMPFSIRTLRPIAPGEALQGAMDMLHQGAGRYKRTILGGEITGLYAMNPSGL